MHPAEIHNRETKTWALVLFLRSISITADDAAHMTDGAWEAAAKAASVRSPSAVTRRLVVGMLANSRAPEMRDPGLQR